MYLDWFEHYQTPWLDRQTHSLRYSSTHTPVQLIPGKEMRGGIVRRVLHEKREMFRLFSRGDESRSVAMRRLLVPSSSLYTIYFDSQGNLR